MALMGRRTASFALVAAVLLAGCGTEREDVPVACLGDPAAFERALERAPARVTLPDGTSLSTCVARARDDADLQTVGASLMMVADRLNARASTDSAAALRLGYLRGAARRGELKNQGIAANLVRRLQQATMLRRDSPDARAAQQRGERAGEDGG